MATRRTEWVTIKGKLTGIPPGTTLPPGVYVYQRTTPALANAVDLYGNRMQVRRHVPQVNPNTPQQQANRATFATGVTAWHALTEAQKEQFREPGIKNGLNRFQQFMRMYMRGQYTPAATQWDGGTTTWDSGATVWDV